MATELTCSVCDGVVGEAHKCISDSNGIRTHNILVRKRTLKYLASLAKWLSVGLRINWSWVRIPLLSLKLQISCLFQAKRSLILRQL